MSESIYPKEVEELKALHDDTQETCKLVKLLAPKIASRRIQNETVLKELLQFLPGFEQIGT